MSNSLKQKPPIWFWVVSALGLIWNGMGVNAYLQQAYNTESYRAMYSAEQLEIDANMPAIITAAFAISVFSGLIGCIGLLLRKKIAYSLLLISLLTVFILTGYTLINNYISSLVMTIMIIVFSIFLFLFAKHSKSKTWLS